ARGRTTPATGDGALAAAESSPIGGSVARGMRWCALLTLALAAGALARGGYIVAKADLGQFLLERAWRTTRATGIDAKPWPWADTHPVARLRAPAQHADVIVLAGATGRTLAWGPGHLDGSARAGDPGNAVFTAHRDTHFAFLADARQGDRLIVERIDGRQAQFRITGMAIVAADALKLRAQDDTPTLTLVTCYPFDAIAPNTRWRYVVSATLVARPLMAGKRPANTTSAISLREAS
ncbi:MAG: class GN sortase, partial [Casimicrobiaceae bacterium]